MTIKLSKKTIDTDSIVDGPGLRAVIWTQGCSHNCQECHNPETHDFNSGYEVNIDDIKKNLDTLTYHDGLTLTGGDPMFQPEAILEIAKYASSIGLNIWLYSGFTFEQLMQMSHKKPIYKKILENIDILVDGKFMLSKKSFDYQYRGSKNQRIIDTKKSIKENKVVEILEYNNNSNNGLLYNKKEFIYI